MFEALCTISEHAILFFDVTGVVLDDGAVIAWNRHQLSSLGETLCEEGRVFTHFTKAEVVWNFRIIDILFMTFNESIEFRKTDVPIESLKK